MIQGVSRFAIFLALLCGSIHILPIATISLNSLSALYNKAHLKDKIYDTTTDLDLPARITHNWGQYSPYYSAGKYSVPEGCVVTQVNLLERHGARFPTSSHSMKLKETISRFHKASAITDEKLAFLRNYSYTLGTASLLPFGAKQAFKSGQEFFIRYPHLINASLAPFIRSCSSERVLRSATNFTLGLVQSAHKQFPLKIPSPLVIPEELNSTLDDGMCPAATPPVSQNAAWLESFAPPIVKRLQQKVEGITVTNSDVLNLMQLCAFTSLASEKPSPFCALFSEDDWEMLEYTGDVDKYYKTGYGQSLGRVQGVGFVNELLARLTGTPVNDHTQTNRTLDSDPITFPLNRSVYADFSHDNQMIAIYSALGLFQQKADLPLDLAGMRRTSKDRTWFVSKMVPFSAQMVTEKLDCEGRGVQVRILVGDVVQPLQCRDQHEGMCSLESFVSSQDYARSGGSGDWEKCAAKYLKME